jgi:hypothetical protein
MQFFGYHQQIIKQTFHGGFQLLAACLARLLFREKSKVMRAVKIANLLAFSWQKTAARMKAHNTAEHRIFKSKQIATC